MSERIDGVPRRRRLRRKPRAGWPLAPRDAQAPGDDGSARLRVATYNIHKGVLREFFGLMRIPRIHELRARLHELDADLIFLQEVQGRHARNEQRFDQWPQEPQEIFLARSPETSRSFESAYGRSANYLHGHHGNALLSRFPIVQHEHRDVSDHVWEKRGLLHCIVNIGGREVHCFVVHFGLFAGSRERQALALVDWISREVPADAPLIVAGDFNDWRGRLSGSLCEPLGMTEVFDSARPPARVSQKMAFFMQASLTRAGWQGGRATMFQFRAIRTARTFPALMPWLRMDRIYQRGFEVEDAKVLRGPAWARLSDHSPLVADLRLL